MNIINDPWTFETIFSPPSGGNIPVQVTVELQSDTRAFIERTALISTGLLAAGILGAVLINKIR
jgi:hypothetical protein